MTNVIDFYTQKPLQKMEDLIPVELLSYEDDEFWFDEEINNLTSQLIEDLESLYITAKGHSSESLEFVCDIILALGDEMCDNKTLRREKLRKAVKNYGK